MVRIPVYVIHLCHFVHYDYQWDCCKAVMPVYVICFTTVWLLPSVVNLPLPHVCFVSGLVHVTPIAQWVHPSSCTISGTLLGTPVFVLHKHAIYLQLFAPIHSVPKFKSTNTKLYCHHNFLQFIKPFSQTCGHNVLNTERFFKNKNIKCHNNN